MEGKIDGGWSAYKLEAEGRREASLGRVLSSWKEIVVVLIKSGLDRRVEGGTFAERSGVVLEALNDRPRWTTLDLRQSRYLLLTYSPLYGVHTDKLVRKA